MRFFIIMFFLFAGGLFAQGKTAANEPDSGQKEEKGPNALFRIDVGKDKSIKVYDMEGNPVDTSAGNQESFLKGLNQQIPVPGLEQHPRDEKGEESIRIEDVEKGSDAKLQSEKNSRDEKTPETSGSIEGPETDPMPIQEKDTDSNIQDIALASPNLRVYRGTGAVNLYTFSNSTHVLFISTSVENNGSAIAGSFRVGFYLSGNTTISTADKLVGTASQVALLNGYFVNKSISVDLDAVSGLTAGTYYVGIYCDDLYQVTEIYETDNTLYFTTSLKYWPNLTIYNGTGSNNSYNYNTSSHVLNVYTSVLNNGTAAAGTFRTGFYLSLNTTISVSDKLVGSAQQASLSNGYYITKSISVDLDGVNGLAAGTYYAGFYYDDQAQVSESNESDNAFYFTKTISYSGIANLTIYTGTGSNNSYNYNTTSHVLNVYTSVINNGTAAAGTFRTGFYLSLNTTISVSDNLVGSAQQAGLSNGYSVNKNVSVDLDGVSSLTAGTYYAGFFFDDQAQVSESNESDNTYYFTNTISYQRLANLTVYLGKGANNIYKYDSLTQHLKVFTSIENNGQASSGSFSIGFYLSEDMTIDALSDSMIDEVKQAGLASGANVNISIDADISGMDEGTYYVWAFYDNNDNVTESNEKDNTIIFVQSFSKVTVGIDDNKSSLPKAVTLHQNYPNPFNPVTNIRYEIPNNAFVKLTIYNIIGKKVATLVNKHQPAGYYNVQWDGTGFAGQSVSSGTYLMQLNVGNSSVYKKIILMK